MFHQTINEMQVFFSHYVYYLISKYLRVVAVHSLVWIERLIFLLPANLRKCPYSWNRLSSRNISYGRFFISAKLAKSDSFNNSSSLRFCLKIQSGGKEMKKIIGIIWRKRSSGFLRILFFTVAFFLFLTPAGGSNPAGHSLTLT